MGSASRSSSNPGLTARSGAYIGSVNLVAQFTDRAAALLQVILLAAAFGVSQSADLFFLAGIAPLTLGTTVGEPLGRAFMDLLVRSARRDRAEELAAAGFLASLAMGVLLMILYLALVLPLVLLTTPGGSGDLDVWIAFAPIVPALALGAYLSSVLLWLEHYGWAAARLPLGSVSSAALLAVTISITDHLAIVAVAVSAGYVATVVALYLVVTRSLGFGWLMRACRRAMVEALEARRRIASAALGGLVGGQVLIMIERALASTLGGGAVATVSYARGIAGAPSVITEAVGAAAYPGIVRGTAAGSDLQVARAFVAGFRVTLLVGAGVTAYLVLFGRDVTAFLLQRGAFGFESTDRAGSVVVAFALGTFASSLLRYLIAVLYGLREFGAVLRRSLAVLGSYLVFVPGLLVWQHRVGLALAYSFAECVGACVAAMYAMRKLRIGARGFLRALAVLLPPIVAVVAALVGYKLLVSSLTIGVAWQGAVRVAGSGLVLVGALLTVAGVSDSPEARHLRASARRFHARRLQRGRLLDSEDNEVGTQKRRAPVSPPREGT